MKKLLSSILMAWLLLGQGQMFSWVYLWEMREESNRSCCLHYYGIDICNPYKPCSGFIQIDLVGILDYINRLSITEHAKLEPHATILSQVKTYIRSVLQSPHKSLSYKTPQSSVVKFYHDIIENDFLKTKEKKEPVGKAKSVKDDAVALHLVKMGLLQKR